MVPLVVIDVSRTEDGGAYVEDLERHCKKVKVSCRIWKDGDKNHTEFKKALQESGNARADNQVRYYDTGRLLRTKLKMDRFDIMVDLEKKYGKFDWRLPEAHALYWVTLAAETDPNLRHQIDYDRLLMYGLQETMRRGIGVAALKW